MLNQLEKTGERPVGFLNVMEQFKELNNRENGEKYDCDVKPGLKKEKKEEILTDAEQNDADNTIHLKSFITHTY